ncbi:hypothetical protein P692DRAFT_20829125 [Suillus brevipes Sb2]|nr:hypothetical protein P692DRAFT_20830046 [Suillus brevipes Sb2]KAG2753298.1 hypothetical protein P692DRAFT_20829125 [Suillus brevipes Sb2]
MATAYNAVSACARHLLAYKIAEEGVAAPRSEGYRYRLRLYGQFLLECFVKRFSDVCGDPCA